MVRKLSLKRAEDYYIKVLLKEVTLSEVMSTPVISINVKAPFTQVPEKLRQHNIRHLPIVGGDNKLVGLISQKDLFQICPPHKTLEDDWIFDQNSLEGIVLEHVMVRNPFYMYEHDCMGDAIIKFIENKHGSIPIVNQDMKLLGIVTQEDILAVAAQIFLE